jgi:large subunit ribosomal protein L10
MNRSEKQQEVDFLSTCFTKAQTALCADYRGLSVAQITALRTELRKNGCSGRVVKNTLAKISVKKALASAGGSAAQDAAALEAFVKIFEGPSFLVFSESDPVAPAKVLVKFAKDNEKLKLKGGWLDGSFMEPASVDALSKMPGREQTLAMLLSLLNTPATQLVRVLQAPGAQLARAIEAHRKNLEQKAA